MKEKCDDDSCHIAAVRNRWETSEVGNKIGEFYPWPSKEIFFRFQNVTSFNAREKCFPHAHSPK